MPPTPSYIVEDKFNHPLISQNRLFTRNIPAKRNQLNGFTKIKDPANVNLGKYPFTKESALHVRLHPLSAVDFTKNPCSVFMAIWAEG
ncbi:hypothetical protein Prudu_013195 [Prunus dulcis]|uniref:Uncharacterized protein n=1 Tax=Prunus dulcis TaxID=3755 RepID=A0A4Y1RE97_PRUDU|nr:hypothetical protein Prudu_013195 [Prunus dulcis]